MENAINSLRIQNFKSIKDVTIKPRRVNLIIGQPNVGKSNVLEALSMLGAALYGGGERFLKDVLRYETILNLFYDNDSSLPVTVKASNGIAVLSLDEKKIGQYRFVAISSEWWKHYWRASSPFNYFSSTDMKEDEIKKISELVYHDPKLDVTLESPVVKQSNFYFLSTDITDRGINHDFLWRYRTASALPKKYTYRPEQPHSQNNGETYLKPPLGPNLLNVVQRSPGLRREIAALFKPYGLNLVLRVGEQKFEIQKQIEDLVYNYPYSLIADTLQRIIFYLAAIESNKDSVLLFEEPEAHTFPVYTTMLGQKIVESASNQFFIATHSPYLLTEIVEELVKQDKEQELAIFLAYYEDYQTKLYQLTDEEVREIRRDAIDVFYNLSRYTPQANPYA